ncbi:MAG: hypothetical protein OXF02_05660 [Simkaniaceae bacterium]|nr:hypothetical protein [Simkaniaceae bacterium]
MATKRDTTVISGPVPKESDVDAPVSLPPKETEIARKVDRVGCSAIDCCPEWFRRDSRVLIRRTRSLWFLVAL